MDRMTRNEDYVQLILLVRSGGDAGAAAQDQLYELGFRQVFNWALYDWECDHETAQDLAQDAILKVLARLADVDVERSFLGFLKTIAHHLFLDLLRRRRAIVDLDESLPDARSSAAERRLQLHQLRQKLTVREAQVLDLYIAFEGNVRQVAQALGVTIGRVHQIRQAWIAKSRRD